MNHRPLGRCGEIAHVDQWLSCALRACFSAMLRRKEEVTLDHCECEQVGRSTRTRTRARAHTDSKSNLR